MRLNQKQIISIGATAGYVVDNQRPIADQVNDIKKLFSGIDPHVTLELLDSNQRFVCHLNVQGRAVKWHRLEWDPCVSMYRCRRH